MSDEMNTQPQGVETPGTDNLVNGPVDVSVDGASPASLENAQPGQAPAGEEVFHQEGDRKFATKEEYVSWSNKQRAAASRTAYQLKQAETRAQQLEAALQQANSIVARLSNGQTPPETKAEAIEQVDAATREAVQKLKEIGGFVTKEEATAIRNEIKVLQEERQRLSLQTTSQEVERFLEANPDAEGHELELADMVERRPGLSLGEAYTLFFGKKPIENSPKATRAAYERGKATVIKKAQAGARPKGGAAASPASKNELRLDWSLLGQG